MKPQKSEKASLSSDAQRLLHYLQTYAHKRGLAKTDRHIAGALRLPIRSIIDLADELLTGGHIVLAEVTPPHGRWICGCRNAGEVQEAWRYADSLRDRGISILARRKRLVQAIRATEALRKVETTGQGRLFSCTLKMQNTGK